MICNPGNACAECTRMQDGTAAYLLHDVISGVEDLLVGNLNGHLVISSASLGAAILLILVLGAAAVVEDGDLD